MTNNFSPSWVSCLDESMSTWRNKYTCPGYMFVPRKPWPFGNEYHSVCCGVSRIMWGIEIVEGQDARPNHPKQFDNLGGKTIGLLVRMTEPIWYKGDVLVLDSGFCVLQALIEIRKRGVFAASVIKKRRFWPKYILGDAINDHFADRNVSEVDCWRGNFPSGNATVPFFIICMKEPKYIMMMMTTYGTDQEINEANTERIVDLGNGRTERIRFKYTEIFYNHFNFRHAVDDHNNNRHQPISVEVTWATQRWANRVFAFIFAISEVNTKLALEYFCGAEKLSMIAFQKKLAKALIFNSVLMQDVVAQRNYNLRDRSVDHNFLTVDPFRRWNGRRFVVAKTRYPQRRCISCGCRSRTYCSCNAERAMCHACFTNHVLAIEMLANAQN